jgi:hypothetical protein
LKSKVDPKDKSGLGYGQDPEEEPPSYQVHHIHGEEPTSDKPHEDVIPQRFYESVFQLQNGSETDSNEYEWDSIHDDEFWRDKQIETINKYAPILIQGEGLGTQPLEFEPRYDNDSNEDNSDSSEIDNQQEHTIIDLDHHEDDNRVMTLMIQDLTQSNDSMPLIYPKLIDWYHDAQVHIPTFHNDEEIVNFLSPSKPKNNCSIDELCTLNLDREGVKSLSCKINEIKE